MKLRDIAIVALLAGCGGGGDDPPAPRVTLLDATVSSTQPTTTPSDWIAAEIGSPHYSAPAGPVEVCADGHWTQWARRVAALELRTRLIGAGAETEEVSATAAGVVGQNVLAFRRCQVFEHAGGLTSARIRFDMRSNGATIPMQGYAVTVRWTVTR